MIDKKDMGKLGPEEMRILRNLADPAKLSEEEKQEAAEYLNNVIGNVEYNRRITKVLSSTRVSVEQKAVLERLRSVSHKTQKVEELYDIVKRAKQKWRKVERREAILLHERLTLREMERLKDSADIVKLLGPFKEAQVLERNPQLASLTVLGQEASLVFAEVNDKLKGVFKSGDIMMFDADKESLTKGKRKGWEGRLTSTFVSRSSHAAQVFMDGEEVKISHMCDTGAESDRTKVMPLYSATYRLDVSKLLSMEVLSLLQSKRVNVQELFEKASNLLHDPGVDRFAGITNALRKRIRSGVADYFPGGHTRLFSDKDGFESFFDQATLDKYKREKIICSAFVGRSVASILAEVNIQLQRELGTKEQVIRMPFDRREIIDLIHPDRLVQLLTDSGALARVSLPAMVTQFVATEEPERQKRFHKAQAALKKDKIALLLEDKTEVIRKLRELELKGVDAEKRDAAVAYMEKLAKEKKWRVLSVITNRFKKIFRVATTKDKLERVIKECDAIKSIAEASIKGVYDTKVQAARERYLGGLSKPSASPRVDTVPSSEPKPEPEVFPPEPAPSRVDIVPSAKSKPEAEVLPPEPVPTPVEESPAALPESKAAELMAKKEAASKAALREHAQELRELRSEFKAEEHLAKQREEARRREAQDKKAAQSARSRAEQVRASARGRGVTARMRVGPGPRAGRAR